MKCLSLRKCKIFTKKSWTSWPLSPKLQEFVQSLDMEFTYKWYKVVTSVLQRSWFISVYNWERPCLKQIQFISEIERKKEPKNKLRIGSSFKSYLFGTHEQFVANPSQVSASGKWNTGCNEGCPWKLGGVFSDLDTQNEFTRLHQV